VWEFPYISIFSSESYSSESRKGNLVQKGAKNVFSISSILLGKAFTDPPVPHTNATLKKLSAFQIFLRSES